MGQDRSRAQVHTQRSVTSPIRLAAIILVAVSVACSSPSSGTMQGIVVDVQGDLTAVTGFTVLVEGDRVEFEPSPDGDYAFPLGHLREHLRTGEPVLVGWEIVGDARVATFLDDA